jgi:hypothetical protein
MPRLFSAAIASLHVAFLVASTVTSAYEIPLDDDSVRDAYFLGQRKDGTTTHFFDAYTKHFPAPLSGPYISQIKLFTPYAQVVELSQQKTIDYSAQDAAQDYQTRGDTIVVYVHIEFTPSYAYSQAVASAKDAGQKQHVQYQAEDFWRDFNFRLLQAAPQSDSSSPPTKPSQIEAREIHATPIYVPGVPLYTLIGTDVRLIYDATKIASNPVSFEVVPSVSQRAVAAFDLSQLR